MHEKLGQRPKEVEDSQDWVMMRDLPRIGYWVGSDYQGTYWNRLQINQPFFESICRSIDLPPIVLTSASYEPPATEEPEMVGYQEAGLKKVTTNNSANSTEINTRYFDLSTTKNSESYGTSTIPIGWNIQIHGNKIDGDISRRIPFATSKDKEQRFIKEFNKTIWDSLAFVALHEAIDTRNSNSTIVSKLSLEISSSSIPLTTFIKFSQSWSTLFLSRAATVNVLTQLADMGVSSVNGEEYKSSSSNSIEASNRWRSRNFPEKYKTEKHGASLGEKIVTRSIPLGFTTEQLFYYTYSRVKNFNPLKLSSTPFVGLADQ